MNSEVHWPSFRCESIIYIHLCSLLAFASPPFRSRQCAQCLYHHTLTVLSQNAEMARKNPQFKYYANAFWSMNRVMAFTFGAIFTGGPTFVRRTNNRELCGMWHCDSDNRSVQLFSSMVGASINRNLRVSQGKTRKLLTPNITSSPSANHNLFRRVGAATMGCLFAERERIILRIGNRTHS